MKKNICICLNKGRIFSLILLGLFSLFGLELFVSGMINSIGIKNSIPIEALDFSHLKKGIYVNAEITHVLGTWYIQPLSGKMDFNGCSTEWLGGRKEYLLSADGEHYITVYVEEKYHDLFDEYTDIPNEKNKFLLTGKIVHRAGKLNYVFLEQALKTTDKAIIEEKVPIDYAVQILDSKLERKKLKSGLFILIWGSAVIIALLKEWSIIEK